MKDNNKNDWWMKLSLAGIFIFILLFTAAASLYPGGSYADKAAKGYSWLNNYWCDLLSEDAKNGLPNTASPVAIAGWFVLCISLSIFWYILPERFLITTTHKKIIRYSGVIVALYKSKLYHFFYSGIASAFLIIINYWIVLTGKYIALLPLIQKITFAVILCWIFFISKRLYWYRKEGKTL